MFTVITDTPLAKNSGTLIGKPVHQEHPNKKPKQGEHQCQSEEAVEEGFDECGIHLLRVGGWQLAVGSKVAGGYKFDIPNLM